MGSFADRNQGRAWAGFRPAAARREIRAMHTLNPRRAGPRWEKLLPELRTAVAALETRATEAGLAVMFWDGWRDEAEQLRYMRAGTSRVAEPLLSDHCWGRAADLVFRADPWRPLWPDDADRRWRTLATLGLACGLRSAGLEWGWDWPHFWLPGPSAAQLRLQYLTPDAYFATRAPA